MMKRILTILACLGLTGLPAMGWSFGGTVPAGLPSNFGIGCIDKNDNWSGDSTGPHRFKIGQACFDYSYQYLTPGWRTWSSPDGQWPVNELQLWEASPQSEYQVFTFYEQNTSNWTLPSTWFADMMVLMQKIEANSTKKVIIHVEPDFLGFCVQKHGGVSGAPTATGVVTVGGGTAPSGWPGTGAQAWNTTNYPDNLIGWAKALRDMQTLVAPNHVLIAHHFTHWGVSSGSSGDAFGQPTSTTDINNIVDAITNTFLKNGVGQGSTSYMDLFFCDPSDRDAGWWNQNDGNNGVNYRWSTESYTPAWGTRSWGTIGYVIDRVSTNLGKRGMMWQIPNGNRFFKVMTNTDGHYQDNMVQSVLPAASANGAAGAPGDAISGSSTTSGPGYWANCGLIGVLFGEGYYAGNAVNSAGTSISKNLTHLRDYGPADGNPTPAGYINAGGPGGASVGQGQANATVVDNDGGYLRAAVAAYCARKFPLPGIGTATPTRTVCVCSPTFTPTLTPTPADCPITFNSCDTLTANGTWAVGAVAGNGASTQSLNTNGAYISAGTGSLKVAVTTASGWAGNDAQLVSFTPVNWAGYDRITFDVYVDPAHPLTTTGATYCGMSIAVDDGTVYSQDPSQPTGAATATSINLVTGWNHLSYPLYWNAANANGVNPAALQKLYIVPNLDGTHASASAVFYVDNIILHTDKVCPSATPTPTYNPNTATPTPTPTPTPADCPLDFNSCDSLTSNGAWSNGAVLGNGASTLSLNTNGAYISAGTGSLKVAITTAAAWAGNDAQLTAFAPFNWTPYDRITFDVYVDPAHPLTTTGATFCSLSIAVDDGTVYSQDPSQPTGAALATAIPLALGWNHLSYNLYWNAANANGVSPLTLGKFYVVPNMDGAHASATGVFYVDNIILHSDKVCPSATPTPTININTKTPTPTITPTPADCPLDFNSCDSLTTNGAWSNGAVVGNGASTLSLNTNGAYISAGTGSLKVAVTTAAAWAGNDAQLTAFTPFDWTPYDRITFDVYVDPVHPLTTTGATYCSMAIAVDDGTVYSQDPSQATGNPLTTAIPLVLGWNHLSYNLYWNSANANGVSPLTLGKFYVVPTMDGAHASATGVFYVDNMVLHSDKVCPPPSPTRTITRTFTPTASVTPSASPTRTATATATATITTVNTATPTNTLGNTATATPSVTGTYSATSTRTPSASPTGTATVTATPSITLTFTAVPPDSTPTFSSTASPSFTVSPTRTASPSVTATLTATPLNSATNTALPTKTATPTLSGTLTVSPAGSPSNTPVQSPSQTPAGTLTNTPIASPSNTAVPSASNTPVASPSNTPVQSPSQTPAGTLTNTPIASPSNTAVPSASNTPIASPSNTPVQSPSQTPAGTLTRTPIASLSNTAVPSASNTPVASPSNTPVPSPTLTSTPSATKTVTATVTPTITLTFTPPPPDSTPTYSRTTPPTVTVTPTWTATVAASASPTGGVTSVVTATQTPVPGAASFDSITAGVSGGLSYAELLGSGFQNGLSLVLSSASGSLTITAADNLYIYTGPTRVVLPTQGLASNVYTVTLYNPGGVYVGQQTLSLLKTPTPAPTEAVLSIEDHRPVPNPVVGGGTGSVDVKLTGRADRLTLRLYTPAMVKVGERSLERVSAGWNVIALPDAAASLHSGLYYYEVAVSRGAGQGPAPVVGRLVVIR